jgi:iron complex transport system ATP-binding protein
MAGSIRPAAGVVTIDGRDIRAIGPKALARRRSVLPQSVALAFPFTVAEVVRLGLPAKPAAAPDALVRRALDAVGLVPEAERICTTLSGGEQQRAHLARALVQLWAGPDDGLSRTLMLDEPTASLDLAHQLLVLRLARAHAAAGGSVLAVLHDLNLAALAADRVVALDRGRVVAEGAPATVITDRLLAETYGVGLRVNTAPARVFVLPD